MNISQLILKSNLPIREISPEEVQQVRSIYLDILKDILYVCEKYQFTPIMGGGSCLGAIRHKGFIPWDDDLDLNMMRKEYDQLPNLIQKEFGGKYGCFGANISIPSKYPFMRVERLDTILQNIYQTSNEPHHIGVDIFPIDNIPNNWLIRTFHGTTLNLIQYIALCISFYQNRNCYFTKLLKSTKEGKNKANFRLFVGWINSFLFSSSSLYIMFDKLSARYQNKTTKDVSIPTGRSHYFGEIYQKSTFFPIQQGSFEGINVPIPQDYDTYLRSLYGDYMKIPSEDKRERHYIVKIVLPSK